MAPARKKGASKAKMAAEFRLDDLVLAKVKGFPAWPAKVSRPEDWERAPDPKKYFVQFFGTQEIAFVAPPDVQAFTSESKTKLVARCKGKTVKYFAQAVKEICDAFEELEKSDLNGPGDDAATTGHDCSVEDLSNRATGSEEFIKSSNNRKMFEKVKETEPNSDLPTEASAPSSVVSVKKAMGLEEIKADTVSHCERIESSKTSSSSPYSSRSEAKCFINHHGDGKKDSPMSLGASGNLKSSTVGDKKSVNGHKFVQLIPGSKRKIDGVIGHIDNAKCGEFVKDRIPQKLSSVGQVKRLPTGVNRSVPGPRGKVSQGPLKNHKLSGATKSTSQDAVSASKECGEEELLRGNNRQDGLEQLQSVKKAKHVHSTSDVVRGSKIKSEKSDLELKIDDEETVRSFGLRTLKSDIPKKRRAVCLYDDDDDDDEPKTPVHGGSVSASRVGSSAIVLDSSKSNNGNHDSSGCTGKSHKDETGILNEYQLKVDDSTEAQESRIPSKDEINKRPVKKDKMDLLSPAKSPLVFSAAKRLVDQQKSNRVPAKAAILNTSSKAENVIGKDSKSVSTGSNSPQKSGVLLSGERAKSIPIIPSRLNGPASSLDNQKGHDSALGGGRMEDAKDRSGLSVDSKALDAAMSMRHLIAAAQAKRRQALTQTAPQVNGKAVLASTSNVHGNSPSPISRGHDMSSGLGNVTENDAQGVHLRGSFPSPHIHIRQLNSEEPEDKRPGSGQQAAGTTLSGGTEAAVARDAFEGMIETLSRTKESIGRATRLAIDCAKYGIANEVVELLIHKLENESLIHRRVDLFFLVDSITQCSHSQKGIAGASYIPIVQSALPRLLGAAAPSGTSARENRRQCLKVLRLWLERKIFPESVLRRFMDDVGSSNDDMSSGFSFKRPSRAERSVDDPIREMEGMLVDEYGSNATFNLPGFLSAHGFVDDDDEDEEYVPSTSLNVPDDSPLKPSNSSEGLETGTGSPNNRHHHVLDKVDGELEMEDVSGNLKDGTLLPSDLSKEGRLDMLLETKLEGSIKDVVESPLMEGSPPLPPESPPPLPPLPTSPPPPPPPVSPSPLPPPPPPQMLPSQPLLPSLVTSGPSHVGNLQPLLPPQPSMAQVFVHPPSGVSSVQAPPTDYSVPAGTHPVQIACNPPQVPCFPTGPSGSLEMTGYSSLYGVPQAGQSNQQFQQSQQFQPCQAAFIPRTFPPATVPQPPSGHFPYNKPTIQPQIPQPRPQPPPAAAPHPYSSASHSEGLRRVGDELWRSASAEYISDSRHNSWVNGGRMPSCPSTNFMGKEYFQPSETALTDGIGYQVSAPKPAMAGPATSGHGINQMLPSRPDMSSLNYWRPV